MDKIKGFLVFYIDVGQLPPFKAEAFVERLKENFKGKEELKEQGYEIIWMPVRPGSQSRIEMLPMVEGCAPVIHRTFRCTPEIEEEDE